MIHSIVSLLTTWAIVLHALIGCCAHHAHAAGGDAASRAPAVSGGQSCCCSHGADFSSADSSSPDEGEQHGSGDDSSCAEAGCSFFAAGRYAVMKTFAPLPLWHLFGPADDLVCGAGGRTVSWCFSDCGLLNAGPRCAPAVTQVWQL